MTYTTLELTVAHRVGVVKLAQPQRRNAFNEKMIAELTTAFSQLSGDSGVAAIVLAAQGPAFCAGADLEWMRRMSNHTHEQNLADARTLATLLQTVYACPKPVIARVHGDTYAGGMGLVAACDIAVAANDANFCLSEVKLGLIPATIAPYVIRAMGENNARRYIITAEKFSAVEAHRIGFVHEITTLEDLDMRINQILGNVMQASANAVADAKRLVREVSGRVVDATLIEDTATRIADSRASADGKEGIASFLAKTKPRWQREYDTMLEHARNEDGTSST